MLSSSARKDRDSPPSVLVCPTWTFRRREGFKLDPIVDHDGTPETQNTSTLWSWSLNPFYFIFVSFININKSALYTCLVFGTSTSRRFGNGNKVIEILSSVPSITILCPLLVRGWECLLLQTRLVGTDRVTNWEGFLFVLHEKSYRYPSRVGQRNPLKLMIQTI